MLPDQVSNIEHRGAGVGEKGGPSYESGWGWDRNFLMICWGGGQSFSINHHEKGIINLPLLLQF